MATATTRLGPADHGRAMTLDDYLDAEVEEGYRYELAGGVLEVNYVPGESHGMIVYRLYHALFAYDLAHPGVIQRFGGGSEYRLTLPAMISGRNPDVAVTLANTPRDARGDRPASLAVEVVSEGDEARERDYLTKRREYLAYGLAEYWIVDPIERRVTVLVRDGDAWAESVVEGAGSATSVLLLGLVVPLAGLWAGPEGREG